MPTIFDDRNKLIKEVNKPKSYFAKIHNRSRKRIYDALNGDAPELWDKMYKHILKLKETKWNVSTTRISLIKIVAVVLNMMIARKDRHI